MARGPGRPLRVVRRPQAAIRTRPTAVEAIGRSRPAGDRMGRRGGRTSSRALGSGHEPRPHRRPAARHGRRPRRLVDAAAGRGGRGDAPARRRRAPARAHQHHGAPAAAVRRGAPRGRVPVRRRGHPHRVGAGRRLAARAAPGRPRLPASATRRPRTSTASSSWRRTRRRTWCWSPAPTSRSALRRSIGAGAAARRRRAGRHAPQPVLDDPARREAGRRRLPARPRGRHGARGRRPRQAGGLVVPRRPRRRSACRPIVWPWSATTWRTTSSPPRRVGITGVLVRTGKFREDQLARASGTPDHVVDSILDVPELLGL